MAANTNVMRINSLLRTRGLVRPWAFRPVPGGPVIEMGRYLAGHPDSQYGVARDIRSRMGLRGRMILAVEGDNAGEDGRSLDARIKAAALLAAALTRTGIPTEAAFITGIEDMPAMSGAKCLPTTVMVLNMRLPAEAGGKLLSGFVHGAGLFRVAGFAALRIAGDYVAGQQLSTYDYGSLGHRWGSLWSKGADAIRAGVGVDPASEHVIRVPPDWRCGGDVVAWAERILDEAESKPKTGK